MSARAHTAPAAPGVVLEVERLQVALAAGAAPVPLVSDVSFALERERTYALVGESGCGKSMTALALMRLLPDGIGITGGSVRLDGADLLRTPEYAMRDVRGGRMAMVFQEPQSALNPVLTVGAQIGEVLARHLGLRGRVARARIGELLAAVGIPDAGRRIDEYPHQLSGGMQQRVMIAMALAGEPEVLIADEPTTALDVTIQAQVLELLQARQRERRMAMLLISHDLGVVAHNADRVGVMYAGELVEDGPTAALFRRPAHPYTQALFEALPGAGKRDRALAVIPGQVPAPGERLTGCRFAPRCAHVRPHCHEVAPPWHRAGDGHRVRCHLWADGHGPVAPAKTQVHAGGTRRGPGEPLLEARGLTVHFPIRRGVLRRTVGHVRAVDGVDLSVAAERTLALVGESGCGKTTAGKAILQLVPPTAGSVRFAGQELTRLRGEALRRCRRALQIVFQDPYASLDPRWTVGEIVAEGITVQRLVRGREAVAARVAELLEAVGLPAESAARYPHEFSGGQRQRVGIARALAVGPRLMVCDEPTSALDVSVQAQILNLLRDLQRQRALAYLFITHNISVVDYLADDVAVMYLGRIVERGPVDAVLHRAAHPYTRALLSAVPVPDPDGGRERVQVAGELPSPASPPAGCHFHPRCPEARPECARRYPEPTRLGGGHEVRCLLYGG